MEPSIVRENRSLLQRIAPAESVGVVQPATIAGRDVAAVVRRTRRRIVVIPRKTFENRCVGWEMAAKAPEMVEGKLLTNRLCSQFRLLVNTLDTFTAEFGL
jgi:hypothetical protein